MQKAWPWALGADAGGVLLPFPKFRKLSDTFSFPTSPKKSYTKGKEHQIGSEPKAVSMFKALKSLFHKETPPELNMQDLPIARLPYLFLGAELNFAHLGQRNWPLSFVLPAETQRIDAYGVIELAESTLWHRFYMGSQMWLQVETRAGEVGDIKLMCTFGLEPLEQLEIFDSWISAQGPLAQMHFDYVGCIWQRLWGDPEQFAPIPLLEKVQLAEGEFKHYEVQHHVQLYGRNCGPEGEFEYLWISAEDTRHSYDLVCSMGIDLNLSQLYPEH